MSQRSSTAGFAGSGSVVQLKADREIPPSPSRWLDFPYRASSASVAPSVTNGACIAPAARALIVFGRE
jgi:hypothetical protein